MSENEKISVEIKNSINKFFEKAAKSLIRNFANKLSESDRDKELKKILLEIILIENYPAIDVQNEYLELLDDIDKLVYGKKDENNSYVNYYKGNELFETDVNISDIIEKVKQSSNSGDMAESLKEEVKKRLIKKNGYRRIAQLYYYKKNHKKYKEKQVEKAYREIVNEVIEKNENNYFSLTLAQKIEKRTKKIVGCAIRASYDKICSYKHIPENYKFSEECYVAYVDNLTYFHICIGKEDVDCHSMYYSIVLKCAESLESVSLSECHKIFLNTVKQIKQKLVGENHGYLDCQLDAYKRYFRGVVTVTSGFNKETVDDLRKEIGEKNFITGNLVYKLNEAIVLLMLITKNDKDFFKKNNYSRFIFINNIAQLAVVKNIMKIYNDIITLRLREEEKVNMFIRQHRLYDEKEIEIIMSADVEIDGLLDKIEIIENHQARKRKKTLDKNA